MIYELTLIGAGFATGWLVFKRPELIERGIDKIKAWWRNR